MCPSIAKQQVFCLNEFELIRQVFDRGPVRRAELGIGDDAALLELNGEQLVTCTDMLVEDTHFFAGADAAGLGHKSLAVNLSDLAAMGAKPVAFVLALALPEPDETWLNEFARGMFLLADQADCELIGGDTTRGPLTTCVTAYGCLPPGTAIRRDRAEPGDDVWVSGALGAAAAAVHWRYEQRRGANHNPQASLPQPLAQRLDWPEPRLSLGTGLRHVASAAIDISDGLVADLAHIADRSRVGISVQASEVPVDPALAEWVDADTALAFAINGGDDYEIAFTSAPENRFAINAIAERTGLALTRIGSVHAGQGVVVVDATGKQLDGIRGGHDHFG